MDISERWKARKAIIDDPAISVGARFLYLKLDDMAGNSGKAWPKQSELALRLRCSDRHVRRWLSELIGYVAVCRWRGPARYRMLWIGEEDRTSVSTLQPGRSDTSVRSDRTPVSYLPASLLITEPRKEPKDRNALQKVYDLLHQFPGASQKLPPGPDVEICKQVFAAADEDLAVLCITLREMFTTGAKPSKSWAWFPAVINAKLVNYKRRRA